MRFIRILCRVLLGLLFVVFGLNGFLHFIPMPPPSGSAGEFMGVLFSTGYYTVIFATQVVGGALVLSNRWVALGLTLLGPVLVNILTFHATMAPSGFPMAIVTTLLWAVVFHQHRAAFGPLFRKGD
ncbi:MAG TPA: hypothetical protein VIM58_03560 [Candidatus Methylacidiphilales bacterium]